jgi:hypothetical protein
MNYGEEIAYWYLRLNGFFPITNFVIHRSKRIPQTSDCDVLAVRMPNVYEEIGGKPEDWDNDFAQELDFNRIVGIICEVKTGRYEVKGLFRPEYIHYAIGRLGFVSPDQIKGIADKLSNNKIVMTGDGFRVCKLLIANDLKKPQTFVFRSLNTVEDFINNRVRRYPREKYADRMYFGSELFQHTIHRIRREGQ